jgi:hypothetical protein
VVDTRECQTPRVALFSRRRCESDKREDLERLITAAFTAHGTVGEMVRDPDDPLNTHFRSTTGVWGYGNLMLRLLPEPERTWRAEVDRHVAAMLRPEPQVDLSTAEGRTRLRARILPADATIGMPMAYAIPFAPGLTEVLYVDLPDTVRTVSDAMVAGSDIAELRAIGRRNLQSEVIDDVRDIGDGIILQQGQSMFVASQLLNPEFAATRVGPAPRGFVAAIPDRNTLLHHAVVGAGSATAITRLAALVGGIDRDQRPGGLLSPHTYYVSAAGVQQITFYQEDGSMAIAADGAFLDAINE